MRAGVPLVERSSVPSRVRGCAYGSGRVMTSRQIARAVLVVVGVLAGLSALWQIREILGMIVIAVFVAVALGPAVDLYGRVMPRWAAILGVYLTVGLAVVGVGLLI